MGLADALAETGRSDEALPLLEEAASMLEPIAEDSKDALADLIKVNEKRVDILKPQDSERADEIAEQLER